MLGLGYDIFIFGVFGVLALNLVEQNPSWLLPEVEGGSGVIAGDLLIGSTSVLGNGIVGDSFTYLLLSRALLTSHFSHSFPAAVSERFT
jgi:hypothetical protein